MKPLRTLALAGALVALDAGSALRAEGGVASVYGYRLARTASGEPTNPAGLTAAHRSLPFGTHVKVTNRRNGRTVVVRINDRGPFIRSRVIDISPAAAQQLGFSGLTHVSLEVVGRSTGSRPPNKAEASLAEPREVVREVPTETPGDAGQQGTQRQR